MNARVLRKTINNVKGFILSELLVAIVIVSLAGLLIAEGISVGSNSFASLSEISEARMILDDYEEAISNTLSCGKFVGMYNGSPVFENKKLSMNGYMDSKEGSIVFLSVKIDYFGNILPTDKVVSLIPKRSQYGNNQLLENTIKYKSTISYEYTNDNNIGRYDVKISITKDGNTIVDRSFSVFEIGEIIKS